MNGIIRRSSWWKDYIRLLSEFCIQSMLRSFAGYIGFTQHIYTCKLFNYTNQRVFIRLPLPHLPCLLFLSLSFSLFSHLFFSHAILSKGKCRWRWDAQSVLLRSYTALNHGQISFIVESYNRKDLSYFFDAMSHSF